MRAMKEAKANLAEFVQQPDACLLLIGATSDDVPYLVKLQEQMAGEAPDSLFFAYADAFVSKEPYALAVVSRLSELLTLENEVRASEGRETLAPYPASMLAAHTAPRQRIIIAIEHLRQWLTEPSEQRVVVCMTPMAIDPNASLAYYEFISEFAIRGAREPWMEYGRVIGLDERQTHLTVLALNRVKADGVLSFDADFSLEKLSADMAQDAVNPAVPLPERMQYFLQLAAIDMSYKRFDEAVRKYAVLYEYYGRADAPLTQAICLLGAGDCLRLAGQIAPAREKYQQGLAQALAAKSPVPMPGAPQADGSPNPEPSPIHPGAPPILLNLLLGAGDTSMTLRAFEDARSYFDSASLIAAKCLNAHAAADALERKGDAQVALRDSAGATSTWSDAEAIAKSVDYYDRRESVLERQRALYEAAGMQQKAREAAHQLDLVRYERQQALAAGAAHDHASGHGA